jgi:4-carboxymuconolactone decarboxylase
MKDVCPAFADMTIEWALGGVMARPGLDLKTRELLLVASCVTLGNAQPQLRAHISSALKQGATRVEVVETILQMLFYAGGPNVSNALVLAEEVLEAGGSSDRRSGG